MYRSILFLLVLSSPIHSYPMLDKFKVLVEKKDFDNALMYYVNKGMLAAGDLKVMSGKKVPTFDGKFASLKGFNAPENLLNDLRERKEIFDEILGKDISDNMTVMGYPAVPLKEFLKKDKIND